MTPEQMADAARKITLDIVRERYSSGKEKARTLEEWVAHIIGILARAEHRISGDGPSSS